MPASRTVPETRQSVHEAIRDGTCRSDRINSGTYSATVRCRLRAVDGFLDRLDRGGVALAEVGIDDIDREVARWHARDCGRITIATKHLDDCLRWFQQVELDNASPRACLANAIDRSCMRFGN